MGNVLYLDDEFSGLMEAADLAKDERTIKQALRNFTASTGFDRFAYVNIRATEIRAFSDYPAEWQRIYLSQGYSTIDPVVISAKRTMRACTWSQRTSAGGTPETVRLFSEAADFGIRSGVSIPLRGSFGRTAILTLASSRPDSDFVQIRDPIRAITAVAFIHVHLNRLLHCGRAPGIELSPRESHCLAWASLGKTMKEISDLLGIDVRTVRFYLDRARKKLDARNVAHAIRLAVQQGLI